MDQSRVRRKVERHREPKLSGGLVQPDAVYLNRKHNIGTHSPVHSTDSATGPPQGGFYKPWNPWNHHVEQSAHLRDRSGIQAQSDGYGPGLAEYKRAFVEFLRNQWEHSEHGGAEEGMTGSTQWEEFLRHQWESSQYQHNDGPRHRNHGDEHTPKDVLAAQQQHDSGKKPSAFSWGEKPKMLGIFGLNRGSPHASKG